MKITREKACQRLHHRVKTPLAVTLDGEIYEALDWSLGGLRVGGWRDGLSLEIGQKIPCHFSLPFQGFDIGFDVELEVLRIDTEKEELAGRFVELGERKAELMHHFIEQLVRGAMVPVEDTILRIDSPVTPVSTTPDPSPAEQVPVNRLPVKLIAMSAFYIIGGLLLFTLVSLTIYNNFLSLRVSTAMTYKPVEPVIALQDGLILAASIETGDFVGQGQELFQMSIPALNLQLDEAELQVERARLELEALRKKHALQVEVAGSHLDPTARSLEIDIDRVQQEVAVANEELVAVYRHRDQLRLNAPDNGRVIEIYRRPGSQVQRGETLALFERSGDASVIVYLNDEDARTLQVNQVAAVSSSIYGAEWQGIVTEIAPTQLEKGQPYNPQRSMEVMLKLISGNVSADQVLSGSPVTVQFHHPLVTRFQTPEYSDPLQLVTL